MLNLQTLPQEHSSSTFGLSLKFVSPSSTTLSLQKINAHRWLHPKKSQQDGIKDFGVSKQSETEGAFSSKAVKNGPRCFSCENYGHIRKDCPKVKNFKKEKKQNQTARSNFATFSANNLMNSEDWY